MARLEAYHNFLLHFERRLRAAANEDPRLRVYLAQRPSWPESWLIALQHASAGRLRVEVGFHRRTFFHGDDDHSTVFLTVAIYLKTCPEQVAERLRASGLLAELRKKRALYAETFLLGRRTDDAERILRERREQLIEWTLGVLRSLHDHMT
jgi:hypothetical protein